MSLYNLTGRHHDEIKSWLRDNNRLLNRNTKNLHEAEILDRLFSEYLVIEDSLIDKLLPYNTAYDSIKKAMDNNKLYVNFIGYQFSVNNEIYYFYMPLVVYKSFNVFIIDAPIYTDIYDITNKAENYRDIINLRAHAILKKSVFDRYLVEPYHS